MDEFLTLAQDINYLFQFSYTGFHVGLKMQKILQFDLLPVRHNWIKMLMRDPVAEIDFADEGDYYAAVITDPSKLVSQIHCIPVILQL